jgi:hypothetical protein
MPMILLAILYPSTLYTFYKATFTDPGYIPRTQILTEKQVAERGQYQH